MIGYDYCERCERELGLRECACAATDSYTVRVWGECQDASFPMLIQPGTDLDSRFKAWDVDEGEFIMVNGWLWTFEPAEAA